jgi:hypothetical protein
MEVPLDVLRTGTWLASTAQGTEVSEGIVLMRRVFGDAVISLCAVVALLLMLVSIDPRVRFQVASTWGGSATSTSVSKDLGEVSTVLLSAIRDNGIDNGPLMIFALAATILVLFMLRT